MALTQRGKVHHGGIVFTEPLTLPEGTEVLVSIEPVVPGQQAAPRGGNEDFASLPLFGMWADRQDMTDGADWVRQQRKQWQQRASRPG